MDPTEYLAEWMIRFLKNKDLMLRTIKELNYDRLHSMINIMLKDCSNQSLVISPFIKKDSLTPLLKLIGDYDLCSIVCYNTKENLDVVIENWPVLSRFKRNFSINFINPFSRTDKRWVVYPMTHELVSDKFRQSLKILASNVEMTSQKDIEKIISEE